MSPIARALAIVGLVCTSEAAMSACFANPVANMFITSTFGMRIHPLKKEWLGHKGVDLRAKTPLPLFAAKTGKVTASLFSNSAGNMLIIVDGNTLNKYFHLTQRMVKEGEMVKAGQQIGVTGNTGKSAAPHLHFEYHSGGQPVDPAPYLCGAPSSGATTATPPPANTDFKNMPSEDEHGSPSSNPDQNPRAETMANQAGGHFADTGAQIERSGLSDNLPLIKDIAIMWGERMKLRAMRLEKLQNVETMLAIRLADRAQEQDAELNAMRARAIAAQARASAQR